MHSARSIHTHGLSVVDAGRGGGGWPALGLDVAVRKLCSNADVGSWLPWHGIGQWSHTHHAPTRTTRYLSLPFSHLLQAWSCRAMHAWRLLGFEVSASCKLGPGGRTTYHSQALAGPVTSRGPLICCHVTCAEVLSITSCLIRQAQHAYGIQRELQSLHAIAALHPFVGRSVRPSMSKTGRPPWR